ncbi:MAG: hypothetical protein DYG89_50235 [Caldilinea sp. CFX5]|nr:hypothetical protein [Caldilinea sp. CFX5]
MTLEKQAEGTTHVFWLFNWGYHPVHRTLQMVPYYQRCDVTQESLTIHDAETTVVVALADIEGYDIQRFYEGSGSGHTTNLRLLLTKGLQRSGRRRNREAKQLFLLTADVFYHHSDGNWELKHLYEVIRCRKHGEEPTVDPNPYHRMLRRRGQLERLTERVWDPFLHPSHYGRVPTPMSILTNLVLIVIGGTFVGALTIGLIYYIVTTFFG